ncbi:hypothetical protein M8J76_011326 [Diaphorina citri]|nr:hypothetical protein M8J76_011326 [Diaphorina citri]
MELVLPQYYFHVTLDLNYVGFYGENSLRSELSWGTTREIVSQIQIQSQFQLNWTHSYLNLTVLTPFKSYEELSLDTKFSLSNRTEDVEFNLQAVGRLPSHEAHLVSRLRYNLHSNRYAASLSANNTLFAISTVDFIFDNTGNTGPSDNSASNNRAQSDNTGSHDDQTPFGNTVSHDEKRQSGTTAFDKTQSDNSAPYSTRVHFSCGPGQADLSLVRIDYTILAERHSGNIDFFTPFAGLQFVSSEFGFHRSLSEFFAKVTPFGVKSSNEGKIFTNEAKFGTNEAKFGTNEAKFGTNEAKIGTSEGRPSQNELKTPQFDAKLPKGAKRSPYEPNQPKPNQFVSKGDYIVSYSFGNSESPSGFSESHSGVSKSHSGVSGTRDSRFDLTVTTPLKPLNRFNILYTVARSSEYKLNFTLNEDVSFAHVNLTGVNRLPFGARVRVDIARIVSDLRVHLDVRSDALNVYAGANGGDLLDLRVESANAYTLQLKFAGNEIHSELELGENSLNYEGKWNNYTLSGSSEYSITYKELWFDCLIKANVRSNAFRTAYDLYIAHDTDSDVINHNIFRTELRVNDVQATHRLEIQMDSALHNKWVNIITVNNNSIVNEYHQVISPNHTDYSYLMTVHLNSTDSLFHLNYSLDTSQIGFTLVDKGFTSVDPDLTSVDSDVTSVDTGGTSVDTGGTSVDNQFSKGFTSVLFGLHSVDFLFSIPELDPFRLTYAIDPAYNAKFALEVRKDKFARVNLSNRDGKHFDLAVNTTYFPPIAAGVDLVPGGAEISFRRGSDVYACSLAYAVPRLATADVRVAVTKNGREDASFRVSYDFSRVNYSFDAGLRYNFSAVYSNSVSVRYETVYLTKYEMVVTTDFELLRELSVNLDLDLKNPQQRQLKLGIILNKEKFLNFGTNLAKTSNKINLSAGLESNLIGSERNNYTLDIGVENLNTHDYLIDLKYIYNDKEVQVNSKVIYNTNAILIEVLLKTPIDNYELVFLKFNIKWTSMNNYSLIFRLQKNTVVTHLNSSIQINHEHSHYTGFIYLTSPHQVFNNVHTDFALSFHNGFNFNVSLQNTNRTIQFICTNVSNSTVLTIFTPYTGFENITLSSLITTQRSHLLIFKNTAQWVKLSFEKRTVKDILFVMELPSYVFINKIDLNIDLAGNISVNMNVVKFDGSREYFAMEFTGGEFKCTIHLPSLNIHHFNAHVKFSVNSARTNVRIFVRIINDATPILYLKINYDESKNFYLNLYKPMTNTSYVSIAGSYRNSEANTGIEDPSVSPIKSYPGNEYQLAIDLTQIDSRFKYNIVLGNNTVQIHDRNRLLYVISYAYNPSGVNLEIVKDSVPDPFLTFALRFDPISLYAVDINVNNTDNFFKYAKLRVHYDNSTSRGQFQLEYLNKVKSWLELTKQPDGLIHLDTKLILNFDSLINVKTRITLNKTEIIPHLLDFDYNYVIRDNYVNNKEYSFKLGNSSLVIESDILNLDIFLTRTISSINFDFESFSINFDHNLESSERFVRFNLTNVNSRNVYVAVEADGGSADGGLADGRVTLEVAYAKHRARVGLSDLIPEEVQYENADNHLSLNLTLRPDTLLVFYNLTGSPEVKDWLTLNTPVLRSLPDDFLIEFHPRENLFGGRSQSRNQKESDARRQNEQSPNQKESGARRQSQGYQNEFGKGPNRESVKSGAAKNSNDGIKNTNVGDHNARNAIIIDLKNAFFKASLNGSSLQYASHHLTLDGPLLSGHANVATAYPVHLIGNAIGHTASFHRDVDLLTADLSNAKGTIFRLHRTADAFDFAHRLGDDTVRLTSRPGSVRFGVDDLTGVRVNASIVYESNAFVNATLLVPKLDLDATVCHRFDIVNERIDWKLALVLNKGALNKDSLSKDSLSKDYLSKVSLNKDFFNNKALNNYFSSKDSLNKDFLNKDSLNKDFLSKDSLNKDFSSKDSLNKDFLSKDSLNKNSLSKESLKDEVYSIEYSGNLSNNKLIITLPDFHLSATNALLSEFDARVNFSANAFGLKWNNTRSATQRMELFAFANADSVDFAYENKEDALTVRTVLRMYNSSSEVILSSAKSKNINFKVTGRNLTFLKDISSFDMTLDCVCSNQVNANVSIDYVTKGTAGNIQIRLIGGENKIDFNLNSNAKNNAVKNMTLGFEFDENSLKGEARYDERFILLEGKLNSGQAVLSLKSSEFNPLQAVGTVEKVAETDKVRTAGFKINLTGNRFVDSIVVKYNAPTQERLMTLNAIGFLRKDQVVSADFTYDLRAHVKHKIVYLNVKYKNKQVVLLENKFSTNEYILNYKIASNVLLNRLHLDYKFLVHANINELRSGSKMKIVIELPELVHLNKTLYVKYNPQGRQYVLQLGDEIDITANASEAKVKLNVFRLNSIAVSRYGPDHLHFDLKNLENPSIPGYNVSDFQAFLNYAKNATGVTAELKIAGHYNAPFTVSASVHLNGSDLIVSGRINEAPFDLTLTNSPGELVVHLNTELFTINLENGFNGEIRANYSLTFLNERHKFALRLTATEFAYEFNDFTIHATLADGYQLTHAYKENRIYAFANASKKALQIVYFRSKAEMSFDGDFKLLLADNDGGRLDVEYIRSSENNFDAYLLLNIPPEPHNSINIQINKTFTDLKLAFDLVDAHVASFSLTNGVERGSRDVNFEYARRHSSDDFTCVAHFTTNRTGVALGTFIRAKNVSTRILNVKVDRDIKRVDLNVYDTLLVNYDFVSNFTFNGIVASKDLNASFNVDFTKNNIYLNVNLLSYSYEFEYEIVQHKVLLKYRRFYQSTLMQHIHLDYHYVRDFYKLKLLIYSLFGVNLEMDANLSLNAKNVNGAVRYQFNKIDNSLVFKVDKTELTKNVEIIAQLPILKLRNYKINFGIDQETLMLVINEISNKQGTYFYFHVLNSRSHKRLSFKTPQGSYFQFHVLNSRSHKRLSFKTPVQLNRNIFVMGNLELDLDERAVTLNSSYSQDTLILLGFNTTNRISDADLSSYLSVITPYAPYDRVVVKLNVPLTKNIHTIFYSLNLVVVKLNVPLTKNIHTIFYSLNLGRDTYEISYNKLTPDKRHSYAIYANTLVWDFHLHDNNVALHLNMLNNSINITSAHLQNFNMSLTNAHKNLTILSNLTIAMTDLSNDPSNDPSNGQAFSNAFSFNVHYEKEASQLDYNFKFLLENELNQNKRLLLNIIYPNNTILFNFDFQYSSIYKNAFTIYTNIFKPISLHIRNNFTSRKDLSTHCEAKYSNHHLFVNFEHKLNQNGFDVNSNVNITINNRTLCLDVLNKFVSRNNLDIKVIRITF